MRVNGVQLVHDLLYLLKGSRKTTARSNNQFGTQFILEHLQTALQDPRKVKDSSERGQRSRWGGGKQRLVEEKVELDAAVVLQSSGSIQEEKLHISMTSGQTVCV